MTLTIAERWRFTVNVQSLARVTYPYPVAPPRPAPRGPDLNAIVQAQRLHEELEAERHQWAYEALLSCRRVH